VGPLLFITYINDLPLNIHASSRLVLFADNTSALITANNLNDLHTNKMYINTN
jgi:hypothetical protein